MSGDCRIRPRSDLRNSAMVAGLPASSPASRTYSCGVAAIQRARPMVERMLAVLRDADLEPETVMTGTPIHRASQVVVPPLYGVVSNAISTRPSQSKYSLGGTEGTAVTLAG